MDNISGIFEKIGLSGFVLKIIAVITMTIDHIGILFFPQIVLLRIIGRLALPIYVFLVVEGYMHTRDIYRYMTRIGIVAILSELPFDLLAYGRINLYRQNVMWTLLTILLVMYISSKFNYVFGLLASVCLGYGAQLAGFDYGLYGVCMGYVFYVARGNLTQKLTMGTVYLGVIPENIQRYGVFAMLPIALYNGQRGYNNRYINKALYMYYPIHMAVLYIAYRIMIMN